MANVILPDGSTREVADGATLRHVAEQIGPGLAKAALLGKIDGQLVDLTAPVTGSPKVEIVTAKNEEGLDTMRHSCAHVMAEAICRLWPEAKLVYGPTVEDGFYYDIDLKDPIRPDDFERIEAEMGRIVQADEPFIRTEMPRAEALEKLKADKYKTDNIERVDSRVITFYSHGDGFEDLCRGPHVPSTSRIGSYKVMSVAGAYWHGDPTEKMLQRVYGTTWANQKDLAEHLYCLEEAKKRDHRVLGKQLELFSFSEMGPGFAFMHPRGMVIWNEIIGFLRQMNLKYGYKEVKTPIILNEELWHRSGHWDNYKENMYFCEIDGVDYAIKPMNCPGGCLLYKTTKHSYREFPLRVSEFGMVHRHEASGVMHGLFRVRQFTQDDAHIYCRPGQIESEIVGVIDLIFETYKAFGFDEFMIELSTKPLKSIGSEEIWDTATNALKAALESKKIDYKINEGDGAFYGPKIDFHIRDCLKRSWQLGTIQLDFSMPQRFDLVYTDEDNTEKAPVMIHRAVLGSFERFMGILIENYAGAMPVWLAPEQARVLPISEKTSGYADVVLNRLAKAGIRGTADLSDEKVGAKIAKAHAEKVSYMLVVGPKEAESGTVSVRIRGDQKSQTMPLDDFLAKTTEKIVDKEIEVAF